MIFHAYLMTVNMTTCKFEDIQGNLLDGIEYLISISSKEAMDLLFLKDQVEILLNIGFGVSEKVEKYGNFSIDIF